MTKRTVLPVAAPGNVRLKQTGVRSVLQEPSFDAARTEVDAG